MRNEQPKLHIEDWNRIKAYCRGSETEPLILPGNIAACPCDEIPRAEKIRALLRYIVVGVAQRMPFMSVKTMLLRFLGARIGRNVFISPGVVFDPLFPELIAVEDNVLLGLGCRILAHEYTTRNFRLGRVRVGRGAVIGAWSVLRSGVTVGANATVGACAFVYKDVPDGATMICAPAQLLDAKSEPGE